MSKVQSGRSVPADWGASERSARPTHPRAISPKLDDLQRCYFFSWLNADDDVGWSLIRSNKEDTWWYNALWRWFVCKEEQCFLPSDWWLWDCSFPQDSLLQDRLKKRLWRWKSAAWPEAPVLPRCSLHLSRSRAWRKRRCRWKIRKLWWSMTRMWQKSTTWSRRSRTLEEWALTTRKWRKGNSGPRRLKFSKPVHSQGLA